MPNKERSKGSSSSTEGSNAAAVSAGGANASTASSAPSQPHSGGGGGGGTGKKANHSNSVDNSTPGVSVLVVGGGGGPSSRLRGDGSPGRRSVGSSSGSSSGGENREMVGGCCVCSDERGWDENPLVYCDGQGCNVAVHQACYGIVSVPTGPWFCRKCESQERSARVRCELCPSREGALKRTDSNSWAHVVCALYIPEVRFGNVSTMEPIVLGLVPQERYLKICYLCLESPGRESRASTGACMQCNRSGCKQSFHVTCAQSAGLLCEEAGNYMDNVKYCGYCEVHYRKINKKVVKTIPAFKPIRVSHRESSASPDTSPEKPHREHKDHYMSSALGTSSSSLAGSSSTKPNITTSLMIKDRRFKKGRKSSSAEIKLEAPKFILDDSKQHHSNSTSSSNSSPRSSQSEQLSNNPENKQASTKTYDEDTNSSNNLKSDPPENGTVDKNNSKPPVVLKFGKDNGTYYNKEVSPSPPVSSPFKKKDFKKRIETEPDTTSNDSSNKLESSSSVDKFGVKIEAMEEDEENSSTDKFVKVSEADLTQAAMRNSCSIQLDKSKIDLKFLRKGDSFSVSTIECSSKTSEKSSVKTPSSNSSSVQLTPIPSKSEESLKKHAKIESVASVTISREKVEPDTSSKANSSSSVVQDAEESKVTVNKVEVVEENPVSSVEIVAESSQPQGTSSSSVTIEQVSPSKDDSVISPATGKLPRISASGKRIGRPPKKGTHINSSSMAQIKAGLSSPPGENVEIKRKRKSPAKRPLNGENAHWMMGTSLNPNSAMAKEMNLALEDEMRAHSVYDFNNDKQYLGVPFLAKRRRSPSSQSQTGPVDLLSSDKNKSQPQTLEELLERQWEQGSQFLMEQASHFDIASLLSSLHQLREENVELEDSVDRLVQRRDHLLAVRARLLALSTLSIPSSPERQTTSVPQPQQQQQQQQQQQNGPSYRPGSHRNITAMPPVTRNASAADISPVSIQRTANPLAASPRGGQIHPQAMHHSRSGMPMPRDHSRSGRPVENGIDYHNQPTMILNHRRGGELVNDRMMSAHLLAVVSSSNNPQQVVSGGPMVSRGHPPPPPQGRQTSYASPSPSLPQAVPPGGHQMMRGPAPPLQSGPPPGHHYGPPSGAPGSSYQIVSPPPTSHGSLVTLDRTSQQHLRNPTSSQPQAHPGSLRVDRR